MEDDDNSGSSDKTVSAVHPIRSKVTVHFKDIVY